MILKIILTYLIIMFISFFIIKRSFKSIFYMDKTRSNKHAENMFKQQKWKVKLIVTTILWPFFYIQFVKDYYILLNEKHSKRRQILKNKRY